MKKVLSGLAALCLTAAVAKANVITYTVVLNDPNAGGTGNFGLYATDSADNYGIASYLVTLQSGMYTLVSTGSPAAKTPKAITYSAAYNDPTSGPANAGFTVLPSNPSNAALPGQFSAGQDNLSGNNLLLQGFGQTADSYAAQGSANGFSQVVSSSGDSTAPAGKNWNTPLLLGTGKMISSSTAATSWFYTTDVTKEGGNTFDKPAATPFDAFTNSASVATVQFSVTNAAAGPTADISLSAAPTHTVAGTIAVASSGPGHYVGTVLKLATPIAAGTGASFVINNVGADPTEVLLWASSNADLAALAALLPANSIVDLTGAGLDADATALKTYYTAQGTAAGVGAPTFLVRFPTGSDAANTDFNITLPTTTLAAITAVPEPASLGLLALGGLGLLARRRSSKR